MKIEATARLMAAPKKITPEGKWLMKMAWDKARSLGYRQAQIKGSKVAWCLTLDDDFSGDPQYKTLKKYLDEIGFYKVPGVSVAADMTGPGVVWINPQLIRKPKGPVESSRIVASVDLNAIQKALRRIDLQIDLKDGNLFMTTGDADDYSDAVDELNKLGYKMRVDSGTMDKPNYALKGKDGLVFQRLGQTMRIFVKD